MKKNLSICILLLGAIIGSNEINAQSFKDKLNAKIEAKAAKMKAKSKGNELDPKISQSTTASKWVDGDYDFYKVASGDGYIYDKPENEKYTVEIIKDDNGKVMSVKIDGVSYMPDEKKSDFVRFYGSNSGDYWNLFFLDNKIIVYTVTSRSKQYSVKGYIGERGKSSYKDEGKIEAYLDSSLVYQQEDIKNFDEKSDAVAAKELAERKAKYSLENKDVTAIKIVNIKRDIDYRNPSKVCAFGHYRGFSFDLEATLKDGTKISTENGGFMADYKISYTNITLDEGDKIKGEFIKEDKIIIKAVSVFQPNIQTTKDLVLDYNEDLFFSWNATYFGNSAHDYRIEIKQVKHKVTNENLLQVRITDITSDTKIGDFKIKASKTIHLYANGHDGRGHGQKSGAGGTGGDGGNITVIKDPSVKYYNLDYKNYGGTGGESSYGYESANGRDGSFKEESRVVNF